MKTTKTTGAMGTTTTGGSKQWKKWSDEGVSDEREM
jgi:hypothetical protein